MVNSHSDMLVFLFFFILPTALNTIPTAAVQPTCLFTNATCKYPVDGRQPLQISCPAHLYLTVKDRMLLSQWCLQGDGLASFQHCNLLPYCVYFPCCLFPMLLMLFHSFRFISFTRGKEVETAFWESRH